MGTPRSASSAWGIATRSTGIAGAEASSAGSDSIAAIVGSSGEVRIVSVSDSGASSLDCATTCSAAYQGISSGQPTNDQPKSSVNSQAVRCTRGDAMRSRCKTRFVAKAAIVSANVVRTNIGRNSSAKLFIFNPSALVQMNHDAAPA